MTKTRQDKSARPAAVELYDAALDRAAGGGSTSGIKFETEVTEFDPRPGTGALKSTDSGRGE